jgi:peptidyl-prolyl cis-trans isomerase C
MRDAHAAAPRFLPILFVLALLLGVASEGAPASAQTPLPATQPPPAGEAPPAPSFDPGTLPEVVARVNGVDVRRDELIEEAQGAYAQLRQLGQAPAVDAAFFRNALDQRIASILLESEAKSRGIAATADEIDQRLAAMRARFESDDAFQRSLDAQGLTPEKARAELGQEISRYKFMERVIMPEIQITDEQARSFYDQNRERMRQPERIKVRHLLIQVAADAAEADRAAARARAEELRARVAAGEDFATLAREHSADGTREQGGELPWVMRGQTLPAFEAAAFALAPGGLSDVVETPLGFHLIQGMDRQPERIAELDEVKERILLVLQNEQAQARLRQTVEGLMAKADVQRFAL